MREAEAAKLPWGWRQVAITIYLLSLLGGVMLVWFVVIASIAQMSLDSFAAEDWWDRAYWCSGLWLIVVGIALILRAYLTKRFGFYADEEEGQWDEWDNSNPETRQGISRRRVDELMGR